MVIPLIDWDALQGRYWKPEAGAEYIIEASNPRIDYRTFGETNEPPKATLVLDIHAVNKDTPDGSNMRNYPAPKEFSTTSHSFIEGIKPVIEAARNEKLDSFYFHLKKNSKGQYFVIRFQPIRAAKNFTGVKTEVQA